MRLLVTERDPLVRRWLEFRAEELGVQLEFAASHSELLLAIEHDAPDCVVMDASSSSRDSVPLWRELRDAPGTCHIPILIYSSSRRWQSVARLAGATVDGFLPRPFTPEMMLGAAREAAGRAAA